MRMFLCLLVGTVFVVCFSPGCGSTLTEEDLGTVIYDEGELPTTGETYPPPPDPFAEMEEELEDGHDHSHDHSHSGG